MLKQSFGRRAKDLGDLGHLLERYVGHDDERRYSPNVLDSELDFDVIARKSDGTLWFHRGADGGLADSGFLLNSDLKVPQVPKKPIGWAATKFSRKK